jgi:CHAT domain-containing protein
MESARRGVDPSQRAPYLAARHQFFDLKTDVLMEAGRVREAFEAAESGRARALAEDLPVAGGGNPDDAFPLHAVQRLLDDETLLLAYALGEERGFLWLIGPNEISTHELPKRDEVADLAKKWHGLLQLRAPLFAQRVNRDRLAATLGDLLLGPVAGRLGRKRLLIVRDEALQALPFAALSVRSETGRGRVLLIEEHEIAFTPSARVLAQIRAREEKRVLAQIRAREEKRAQKPAAVFANPDYPSLATAGPGAEPPLALQLALADVDLKEIRRLPWTHDEAVAIQRLAGPRTLVVEGADVNRERITTSQLADYRLLHFATHGLLNQRNPQLSGLLLSFHHREGKFGFLRAADIEGLSLEAHLVTLSACSTAIGDELRGEGLLGLKQAFLKAGASRVMVSAWNVGDKSTAALMTRFYKALLGGLRPAAALRVAQRAQREETPQPADWAAFLVEGDW